MPFQKYHEDELHNFFFVEIAKYYRNELNWRPNSMDMNYIIIKSLYLQDACLDKN